VFVLALGLGRDAKRARRGLQVFVYAGFAYALYGLIAFFSGSELILWFGERLNTASLTSTFENRNTYATLAGMGLVAAFALFLDGLGRVLRARVPPRTRLRWTLRHIFGPAAPLLVAMLVIGTALLLTASRGGTFSTLFGLLVLAGAFFRAGALPARAVSIIAGSIVVGGVLVFALSGDHLAKRLEHFDREMDGRAAVYTILLGAVADAPLLGAGYGTFPDVFPLYRDASIARTVRWEAAHNTYLENLLELGVPAAAALFASIAACARICWLGIRRRRRHRVYPMVGLAVTAVVAAHATVDFSLQIPAVSYAYAFLLGLACAQSFPSQPSAPLVPQSPGGFE
jgi:O-antigen ligase